MRLVVADTGPLNYLILVDAIDAPPKLRALQDLDVGERAALALARERRADLVLMDDRSAVAVARQQGFTVTGTRGILDLAAARGQVDLAAVILRLKGSNFRYRPEPLDGLLERHRTK